MTSTLGSFNSSEMDGVPEVKGPGPPSEHIGVQVCDYLCVGDEAMLDFHIFTVRIWNEREKLSYAIQRSYSSFCEFHVKLARKYPRTSLPALPLVEYGRFLKQLEKMKAKGDTKSIKSSVTSNVAQKAVENKMKRKDMSEVISQKKTMLTTYLEDLLKLPEVLMAEEFLMFLDEESSDGLLLLHPQSSAVDISLLGEDPETKTVLRSYEIVKEADEGFVVAWSFCTKSRDIGFSVDFDGKTVVPYQRYDSHAHTVSGMISVPGRGEAKLIWDNTYSKLRSKVLVYRVRVVHPSEFETASRIADEKMKDRQRLEQQRQLLKRIFSAYFKQLFASTGSIRSSITINDQKSIATDRLTAIYQDREEELRFMREEVSNLEQRINELEAELEAEKLDSQQLSESLDETELARDRLEKELAALQEEQELQSKADEEKQLEIGSLKSALKLAQEEMDNGEKVVKDLQEQYVKSKAEKKQLKTYALQLKSKEKEWDSERQKLQKGIEVAEMKCKQMTETLGSMSTHPHPVNTSSTQSSHTPVSRSEFSALNDTIYDSEVRTEHLGESFPTTISFQNVSSPSASWRELLESRDSSGGPSLASGYSTPSSQSPFSPFSPFAAADTADDSRTSLTDTSSNRGSGSFHQIPRGSSVGGIRKSRNISSGEKLLMIHSPIAF